MALILPFQGFLFGGKTRRHSSIPIGSAAARAHGSFRCRTMETAAAAAATDLRSDFLQVLRSRRRNPDGMHLVEQRDSRGFIGSRMLITGRLFPNLLQLLYICRCLAWLNKKS